MNSQESRQVLEDFLERLNQVAEQSRDDVLIVQLCSALREALKRRLSEMPHDESGKQAQVLECTDSNEGITPNTKENPQTADELFIQCTGRSPTNHLDDRVLLAFADAKIRGEKALSPHVIASRLGIDVGLIYREGWSIRKEIRGLARESGNYFLAAARNGNYFLKRTRSW